MTRFTEAQMIAALAALGTDPERLTQEIDDTLGDLLHDKEIEDSEAGQARLLLLTGALVTAVESGLGIADEHQTALAAYGSEAWLEIQDLSQLDREMREMELIAARLARTASQLHSELAELSGSEAEQRGMKTGDLVDEDDDGSVPEDTGPIMAVEGAASYLQARIAGYRMFGAEDDAQENGDQPEPLEHAANQAAMAAHLRHAVSCLAKATAEAVYDIETLELD